MKKRATIPQILAALRRQSTPNANAAARSLAARGFSVSPSTVAKYAAIHGYKLQSRGRPVGAKDKAPRGCWRHFRAAGVAMLGRGKTVTEVADRLAVPRPTVARWAKLATVKQKK